MERGVWEEGKREFRNWEKGNPGGWKEELRRLENPNWELRMMAICLWPGFLFPPLAAAVAEGDFLAL